MVSLKQNVVCTLAVIMVFMLVSSYARPVAEEDWPSDEEVEKILHSPVIAAHVRCVLVKMLIRQENRKIKCVVFEIVVSDTSIFKNSISFLQ